MKRLLCVLMPLVAIGQDVLEPEFDMGISQTEQVIRGLMMYQGSMTAAGALGFAQDFGVIGMTNQVGGNVTATATNGLIGFGLNYPYSASRVSTSIVTMQPSWSVSFWTKRHGGSGDSFGAYVSTYNGTRGWIFGQNASDPTTLRWRNLSGTNNQTVTVAGFASNQWQHIAMTIGGGTATIYRDGTAATSFSSTVTSETNSLFVGSRQDSPASIHGGLDEIRIYNGVTLGADEVLRLWQMGKRLEGVR